MWGKRLTISVDTPREVVQRYELDDDTPRKKVTLATLPRALVYLTVEDNTVADNQPVTVDWSRAPQLEHLVLQNCMDVERLLHDISRHCPKLRQLDLVQVRDRELPLNICDIPSLTGLYIRQCEHLTRLPARLPALSHLRILDISDCPHLVHLPDSLGYLQRLECLKINSCQALLNLPSTIGMLQSLKSITLWGLAITKLPESFTDLTSLLELSIIECRELASLPDDWRRMQNLRSFTLENAESLQLPLTLASLRSSLSTLTDRFGYLNYTGDYHRLPLPQTIAWGRHAHKAMPLYVHRTVLSVLMTAQRMTATDGRFRLPPELWHKILESWYPLLGNEKKIICGGIFEFGTRNG